MAVDHPLRLDYLLPDVETLHLNARSIPGLQVDDYESLLGATLEKGLIQLSFWDEPYEYADARPIDLANALAALPQYTRGTKMRKEERLYIRLTEKGAGVWEEMAAPQWDRFFYYSCLVPDKELRISATLASRNLDAVIAYLGWFDRLASVDVSWETLKIERHSNYPVTYWKRLDGVREATFDGIYHLPEQYAPAFASDWMLSLSKWRLRPWERPDWEDGA